MNYEQMLANRIALIEANAQWCIGGGVILGIVAVLALAVIKKIDDEGSWGWLVCALVLGAGAILSPVMLVDGLYQLNTKELKAKAYLANYNLVNIQRND